MIVNLFLIIKMTQTSKQLTQTYKSLRLKSFSWDYEVLINITLIFFLKFPALANWDILRMGF